MANDKCKYRCTDCNTLRHLQYSCKSGNIFMLKGTVYFPFGRISVVSNKIKKKLNVYKGYL